MMRENEQKNERYSVDGRFYSSLSAVAQGQSVSYTALWYLVNKKGYSAEDAVVCIRNKGGKTRNDGEKYRYTVKGKQYKNLKKVAEDYNTTFHALQNRMRKLGLSLEEAVDYVPTPRNRRNAKPVDIDGHHYETLDEASRAYGKTSSDVKYLMETRGISLQEALKVPKGQSHMPHKGIQITVNGVAYKSVAEACRKLGLNTNTVFGRLRYGFSIEEAFKQGHYTSKKRLITE